VPRAAAGDVELEYEVCGDPSCPAVLLLAGLGGQLISWDDRFCSELVAAGLSVIRFDNRDTGLSTKLDQAGLPDLLGALLGSAPAAYTLDELADDAAAVLDAAGVEKAHVLGISMGGMVAQLLALRHPDRVLTLTCLMSGPAGRPSAAPSPEVVEVMLRTPTEDFAGRVTAAVELRRVLAASEDFDVQLARLRAEEQVLRAYFPAGTMRQAAAVLATPNHTAQLARINRPALIVHGDRDPLVPFAAGTELATAIPGASFLVLEGVGHDLPEGSARRVLEAMLALIQTRV
jgi:pimeloyl-ACP methyl ester carboxylesterase